MDTVIVTNNQFYSHYPKRIPKGTVNAEHVEIRLDSEWDNLTVRIHWLNVASGVEKVVLLERDQPNTIPWEVLADLSELRLGLVGLDGETVIKPTIWLTYGYVVDGVDPEAGDDPHPPTPSWEQQMVELARVAAEAAQEAKDAAVNAEKAASQVGPYADEAQKSAEAAKEAQRAASTSSQEAGNARDQANTAANAAKGHASAAGAAKESAERAAETAGNAQSEASKSAKSAANSAKEAEDAKLEAQKAAAILPAPTQEDAGKVPMVNPEGTRFVFVKPGEIWDRLDDITLNSDVLVYYIAKLSKYDKILLLNDGPYSAERGNLSWRIGFRNNLDQKVGTLFYATVSMNNMHRDILFESELFDDGYIGSISARWNNNGQLAPVQASFSGKMLNKHIKNSNAESMDVTLEFESLTEVQINGLETINVFGRRR